MAEFKIEVPIEVTGGAGGAAAGGGKELTQAVKKLDKTMFMNIDVLEILTQFFGDILKAVQPLIKVLSLLLFMFFLPALPVIVKLTQWIAKLASWMPKVWDNAIEAIVQFILLFKKIGGWIVDGFRWLIDKIKEGAIWVWEQIIAFGSLIGDAATWLWEKIIFAFEFLGMVGQWIQDKIFAGLQFIADLGLKVWNFFLDGLDFIADLGSKIWDFFLDGLSFISDLGSKIWTFIKDALKGIGGFFNFANGGRPPVGAASIVGERGPELFVPDSAGTIIPNGKFGGGGSITINVTGNRFNDENDMRKMVDILSKKLQQNANRSFS